MTVDFLTSIQGLILDMDGVLWRDDHPLLDLPAFFAALNSLGLKCILATNNATRSPAQYQEKLRGMGVNLPMERIINSSMAAGFILRQRYPQGGSLFVVGEEGLQTSLEPYGFHHSEENPLAVVAGLDRTMTYPKLRKAALLIRAGVPFYGTNPDLTYPSPEGLAPGAGAVLAFLEASTSQKPIIAGKPNPYMFDLALQRMNLQPHQVLAVGDRLDTDIQGAQSAGCRTAGVLSGVSTAADMQAWQPAIDLILPNLKDLVPLLLER